GSGESWFDAGDDHYDFDPLFADSTYALSEYSHAIGRGGTSIEDSDGNDLLAPGVDILGNPRPNPAGSNPDIGAYEHVLSDYRRSVYYVDDANGDDGNDGLSSAESIKTISGALGKSSNRDTLELAAGTYSGADNRNLNMGGLTRIIRTSSGPASTIIDCENQAPAFVFDTDEPDSVHISGLTIINGSSENGGAVSISGADPVFENMIFRDNNSGGNGGAVYASDSYSSFTNCVFVDNHAAQGGAFAFSGGAVTLDFITAVGNHGDDDVSFSGAVSISNSILWGNSPVDDAADVTYSDVMGGNAGTGNYNGRPGFTDGFNGDFTLKDWSPVIGQASAENAVLYDIEGNARSDSIPDMGAYENTLDAATTYTRHYWYVSTWGSDSVSTNMGAYENPFATIQHALNHGIYDDEIHIAPGAYSESLNNWGKDLLVVGGAVPSDVTIDGNFEINGGSPVLYDLHLTNNNGTNDALQINNDAVVTMYNLLITNSNYAGVTVNNDAIATMYNLTIYGNTTGIYDNSTGTVSAVNSILWNNTAETYGTPTITYSDVEDGYTGTGNIDSDPDFVAAENGDFNLQITSPCIDAGDSTYAYDSDSTVTDMGAFPLIR
ncbi:MAG: DUF1565 domain-containing protein, partial [Candidatus Marinimicrobia bacterium]|nr:DUF1565 domain-containing protein [Candidatus Neomarinimicrobiota bacterium]